jgi:hypothetical protein
MHNILGIMHDLLSSTPGQWTFSLERFASPAPPADLQILLAASVKQVRALERKLGRIHPASVPAPPEAAPGVRIWLPRDALAELLVEWPLSA